MMAAEHLAARRRARLACLALVGGLLVWAPAAAPGTEGRYTRSAADYRPPDVTLVDQAGARVRLADELAAGGPVLLQFIFTTCSTICPAMSGTFAAVQEKLPRARLVSISIDPDFDTPARLADYARRFDAGPRWRLLGGRLEEVIAVERAFDAYRGNKMRHEPLTFIHAGPRRPWLRLEGLLSAAELAAEVRLAGAETAASDAAPAGVGGVGAVGAAGAAGGPPGGAVAGETFAAAVERGRRIYRDGVLPSGRPLRGLAQGDVPVAGARLACVSCHRPSGFGGVEGGTLVPPVTGPALFSGAPPSAGELLGKLYQEELSQASWSRLRAARERPAYTAASLAAALRRGSDPEGRALDPLMPRYELDGPDLDDLIAYLRTLSAAPAPGVDAAAIHFAVVVAPDVDAGRKRAMLDVAEAFFRYRNAETRHLLDRPAVSPGFRADLRQAWRQWVLHVWQLEGPPASWAAQLARSYGERPVFALLSGLGAGEWRPVHEFCERTAVPCVFPNVDLPVAAPPGAWTLYLSAGLTLEARALGRHLAASASEGRPARIVQLFRDQPPGRVPAAALREELRGAKGVRLDDLVVGGAGAAGGAGGARAGADLRPPAGLLAGGPGAPTALVLWLDRADLAALAPAVAVAASGAARLYLSYSLLGEELPALPPALRDRTFLTFRYALPGNLAPQGWRSRAWLRSRGVASGHERIELDTLFTLAAADDALGRMAGRFSREYFVETLEREAERDANPGVFPRLGLGAGQRFASKGCYIVKPAAGALGGLAAASDWIVP
ncbi:MAG TPA: SCO family protein [Thermoanaerobaculia bacterium]|nr:SCO family protein [Thermoanaerobaculia bacterium]